MILTAAQVRQACALLRWSSPKLSRAARVPYDVARKARTDEGMLTLPSMDVGMIHAALEKAGIQFEADAEGRTNAVLAKSEPRIMPGAPDRLILRWLARRTEETASSIGAVYGMALDEVRAHLASLGGEGLVVSRSDESVNPPRRLFQVTAEGHRAIGAGDERSTT